MNPGDLSENNILYELLIYSEWPQDPEILIRGANDHSDDRGIRSIPWTWLNSLTASPCPSPDIQSIINLQLPWQFAVGGEGRVIAILQEQYLEIRSSRDEYGSVIGRVTITKDLHLHWRKLAWSPDCTMLALSHSNGDTDIYDLIGAHLFTIENPMKGNNSQNMGDAIVGLVFCNARVKNTQWSYELIIVNHRGSIRAYFVSPTDGYRESHEFSVSSHYPYGISSFCYHQSSQILLMCGKTCASPTSPHISALDTGLTAWRILLDQPYYRLSLSLDDEKALQNNYLWFLAYFRNMASHSQDLIYKMSISPNNDILAAVHTSGALSLWDLPSLRFRKKWDLVLQPNYADINPQYCEPGMKRKIAALISNPHRYHLNNVSWWSDDAIILARLCGSVTVSSINSLRNLLGISAEWFEPSVQISPAYNRGFLAIECENIVTTKKRSASEVYRDLANDESSDDEDPSIFTRTAEFAKKVVFYVTDNERFRPPRKKIKFLNKTYRLLCLKSTTPEELFSRKINDEEYGEALALAKTYNLDSDLVYQRQWRKTPASVASIQDYLSKITKRSWVLHECLERVPETIEAAKELLLYGLRGTDLQALISIGKGEDHGRFIVCDSFDDDCLEPMCDGYSSGVEDMEQKKQRMEKKRAELLKKINFSKLTLEQTQICQCRLKLLVYLDRLTTYEAVLGGPLVAEEFYDYNFFKKFRSQGGFEACVSFAHNSNWQAIAVMFTYHGTETLQHRLGILSSFPETTSPLEYQTLLPKLGYSRTGPVICTWTEDTWRLPDWCEIKCERLKPVATSHEFVTDFYEENQQLLKYKDGITPELLTEWFYERAHEIENRSFLVDNALDLVNMGIERNVQGLEKLRDDLKTLEMLIYECQLDTNLTLAEFEERDDFEVVQLLMSKATEENFIKHIRQFLLPYLEYNERHKSGTKLSLLKRYITDASKGSLLFCRKVFENSRLDQPNPLIPDVEHLLLLAVNCIYTCERTDCVKDICVILEYLPNRSNRNLKPAGKLWEDIETLQKHLRVAELLEKNGTAVTLGFIKTCSEDPNEVRKLLTKLTRLAGRRSPALNETEWKSLLFDIMEIQKQLSSSITTSECYEVYLHSLLCSGRQETISLAGKMMECSLKPQKLKTAEQSSIFYKLPYENSVSLVLKASQEYFNSSAGPTDPCMSLAGSCLNLIEDISPSIEEEVDLISSLKLLQEFNVKILPLQVRLCSDRLTLIHQALVSKDKAYRNAQKLMRLAFLLRVCGSNKETREGKVLSLIAQEALQAEDYEPCLSACRQLIAGGYQEGWSVCYKLGSTKEFQDLNAKREVMSFALAHCTPDLIEDILRVSCDLLLQVIYDRIKFLAGDKFDTLKVEVNDIASVDTHSNVFPASDTTAIWSAGEKTLQVLHNTTETTKAVLTSVGSRRFWREAVKWIKPNELSEEEYMDSENIYKNKDFNLQGVCSFYSGLIENPHISKFEASYQRLVRPDLIQSLEISSSIFRAAFLEDTLKNEADESSMNYTVLYDLVKAYLPEDTILALSFMLCLQNPVHLEDLFNELPNTPVMLQLASLFYAIQIAAQMDLLEKNDKDAVSLDDPAELIRKVEDIYNSKKSSGEEVTDEIHEMFNLLTKYNNLLYDFIQAEILHSIGGGVDAARFTEDDIYKRDTILGIAMTLDDSVFGIAVSLGHHYKFPLWDIYMAQLEYLFSDSRISIATIEARISNLKLLDVLYTHPELFKEKLENSIYPNIDGEDHAKLIRYFSLLEGCCSEPTVSGLMPNNHIKLIKVINNITKNLNYKSLVSPDVSPLPYLSALLNNSNVQDFAKAAGKIPDGFGSFLEPSNIFCLWIKKSFFKGRDESQKTPEKISDWIHRYEACNDIIQKLNSKDFMEFINYIIFSEESFSKLQIGSRLEIIKRALKFSRQKVSKNRDDSVKELWQQVVQCIQKYQQHLQKMEDPLIAELKQSTNLQTVSYLKKFELSASDLDKLKELLIEIVINGPDLSLLTTLLAYCPKEMGWDPSDAYIQAINSVINNMRGNKNTPALSIMHASGSSSIIILENILKDITEHRDDMMIDDIAINILYDFCLDGTVSLATRLRVLQILEKTDYFSEDYSSLLLLYQTQVVVKPLWPDIEVTEESVKDESERYHLFTSLTSLSSSVNHFAALAELLCHWPPFHSLPIKSDVDDPWCVVLYGLSSTGDKEGLDKTISFFNKAHSIKPLSQQASQKIFHEVVKHKSILHSLKFAFMSSYSDLHMSAISMLKEVDKVSDEDFDSELLDLVLKKHLTVHLVSTYLYKPLVEYLLNHQNNNTVTEEYFSINAVVKELVDAGFEAEAGSLLLISSRTHTVLNNFSSALDLLSRWLLKPGH